MPTTRAYLRFTAGEPTTWDADDITFDSERVMTEYGLEKPYFIGSEADVRNGDRYDPDLTEWPLPETGFPDELGIAPAAEIDLTIIERPEEGRLYRPLDDEDQIEGVGAELELDKDLPQGDGTETTFTYPRKMTIARTEMEPGLLRFTLRDTLAESFEALFPDEKYTTTDWPNIYPEQLGRTVPYSLGSATHPARHVPGTIVDFTVSTGETKVAFGKPGAGSILTVYRGGPNQRAVVDASEYTVANESGFLVATFPEDQKDANGRFFVFSADVVGTDDRNVWAEIQRHIERLGQSVDTTSFTAAKSKATGWDALVTCDYGSTAGEGQRTVRAILQDLLFIGRGAIYPNGAGEWVAVADDSVASAKTYDQDHDLADIQPMPREGRRETITVTFAPSPEDPARNKFAISRTVPTGRLPAGDDIPVRFLADGTAADKLAYYLALKEENNRRGIVRVWDQQYTIGDVITLKNANLWDGERVVKVVNIAPTEIGDDLTVRGDFDPDAYVAGSIPAESTQGYVPDFSGTFPDAPTDLTVDSQGTVEDNAGDFTAFVVCTATPPSDNFQRLIFEAIEDGSGAILSTVEGEELVGGDWEAKLGGLPTNKAMTIQCWARNRFALDGDVASVAHTTATDAGDPDAPATVTANQGTALYIAVEWDEAVATDVIEYELQRKIGAGSYSTIFKGKALGKMVRITTYDSHTFQVRSIDRDGNTSSFTESSAVNATRNVGSADLVDGAVITSRVADDNVTSDKRQDVNFASDSISADPWDSTTPQNGSDLFSITISESKTPIATLQENSAALLGNLTAVSSTSLAGLVYNMTNSTVNATLTVYYW